MKFPFKFAALTTALALSSSLYAADPVCPNIEDIKLEGISNSEPFLEGMFFTYELSNFNTESPWGFIMAPVYADTQVESLAKANDLLHTMTAPGVPYEQEGQFYCTYETGIPETFAVAVKSDESPLTASKLKQFYNLKHK